MLDMVRGIPPSALWREGESVDGLGEREAVIVRGKAPLALVLAVAGAGAAARLGMKRTTLQSKMRKLGISRQS